MEEKECKPLTSEFLEQFLLEAQHHSGLPLINPLSIYYLQALSMVVVPDDLLDSMMDEVINGYMTLVHKVHRRNKTWKSYDW